MTSLAMRRLTGTIWTQAKIVRQAPQEYCVRDGGERSNDDRQHHQCGPPSVARPSSVASGTKITDANPPRNVSTVRARLRLTRNQVAITANAGSYSTAAIASPINAQIA